MNIAQYPDPTHTILHLSDTHLVDERRPLYGVVDSDAKVATLLQRLRAARTPLDAIVLTGDLADTGAPDAYRRLRQLIVPFAEELGCPVLWVMGNHDDRAAFRVELLREAPALTPLDHVHDVAGLRIITLDSTVPGHHHGQLAPEQLDWLRQQLSTPAEHGTVLALHHPPVPTTLVPLQLVELREASQLENVVRGSDVRAVLAGHFHYATHSTFAGVPVSVAAATCYTQSLTVTPGHVLAVDANQSAMLVHVYPDRIVHTQLPLADGPSVYSVTAEQTRKWAAAARLGESLDTDWMDS